VKIRAQDGRVCADEGGVKKAIPKLARRMPRRVPKVWRRRLISAAAMMVMLKP
jgi:hypothetical protein